MHRLVASATACLLVLHMVLGCCWHHRAHAGQPAAVETPACDDCCCVDMHGEGADPPHEPQPGDPGSCQHEQCTFVAGTTVRGGAADEGADSAALVAPLDASNVQRADGVGSCCRVAPLRARSPHVPLHVLYGALLI